MLHGNCKVELQPIPFRTLCMLHGNCKVDRRLTMSTAIEEMHELEPHIRVGRARAAVIMLILSDALSVFAILAAGGYLNALNVSGQFRGGDHAPPFLPGLL